MQHHKTALSLVLACCLAGALLGCGGGYDASVSFPGPSTGAPSGNLGATPGGAQDIGYARRVIDEGGVPAGDSITVEGLLSEHDLPAGGEPCESLLCARPALAVAPSLETGRNEHWLLLGMSSGLRAETFRRPPLDVVVVLDRSTSMAGDMPQVIEATVRLVRQLRDDDRVGIVLFDDHVEELRALGPVGDRDALEADLRDVRVRGSADFYAGLDAGYAMARTVEDSPDRMRRVMVFSCGFSGYYADEDSPFTRTIGEGAAERIGFSFYGVLLAFDYTLANQLSQARGGTYSYLESLEKIEQVFDTDFDYMVTPLAYDLQFALSAEEGFDVERVYGAPGDPDGAPRASIDVSTAFLSRRRGGVVVRLSKSDTATDHVGTVRLSYEPEPAVGFRDAVDSSTAITRPETTEETFFESAGVRKAVALVNAAEMLRRACDEYRAGAREEAVGRLTTLRDYLIAEADVLSDDGLRAEAALVDHLLRNMGATPDAPMPAP